MTTPRTFARAIASLLVLSGVTASAGATTRTVCTDEAADYTSIQVAVDASSPGDLILLCDGVHEEADIVVAKAITIEGRGRNATILQAANNSAFATGRVITLDLSAVGGGEIVLRDMTVRNGNANSLEPRFGGGVLVTGGTEGKAVIERCAVRNNEAAFGAGIAVYRTRADILNSFIQGNVTTAADGVDYLVGGGIGAAESIVTVGETTLSNNRGQVGGGIGSVVGSLTVRNSALHSNDAVEAGGGVFAHGELAMINTTVSGNQAPQYGGVVVAAEPIFHGEMLGVVQSTIAFNSDVGLSVWSGSVPVANTLVTGHRAGDCSVVDGTLTIGAGDRNLSGDYSCPGFSLPNSKASLLPLAENGGPTVTHALDLASHARDAGDNALCAASPELSVDQRGAPRLRGAGCDLGAVEGGEAFPRCALVSNAMTVLAASGEQFVNIDPKVNLKPGGGPYTVRVDDVRQDEPVMREHTDSCPDAMGVGTSTPRVRAELEPGSNGRVYRLRFTARNPLGDLCTSTLRVGVSTNGQLSGVVDDGSLFDAAAFPENL